jgi:hypothetical protein
MPFHAGAQVKVTFRVGGSFTALREGNSGCSPPRAASSPYPAAFGKEFDRAYDQMQLQAHEEAVALFSDYARNGDNTDLKTWAAQTLPHLRGGGDIGQGPLKQHRARWGGGELGPGS